jgi:hypothetical protein
MLRHLTFIIIVIAAGAAVAGSQTANWIKFVPPDGSFSVLMPVAPELHTTSKDNPSGKIVTSMWVADTPQGFYLSGFTDYPVDLDVQTELDRSRDNFLKAVDAKLVSESDFTIKGYPGKEITGVSSEDTFKFRQLVVGRRNYGNVTRHPTASFNVERVNKFFQSFELTEKAR